LTADVQDQPAPERSLPPVAAAAGAAIALVFAGGIYMVADLPHRPSLGPAVGLLATAATLLAGGIVLLRRRPGFAWRLFLRVGSRGLLAYGVIAGMLEYVLVRNGTRGDSLVLLTLMLAVFAVAVATAVAFTVARYERAPS
jgi:hypothetical protein